MKARLGLTPLEDRTVPTPVIDVTSFGNVTEGGGGGLTFTRTVDTAGAITVNYSIGGTATNGSDHSLGTSDTVNFADGIGVATVFFTPTNDTDSEPTETMVFTITSGTGYTIGTADVATVNLFDNDAQVVSVANSSDATEGGNGAFQFTRIGDLSGSLDVDYVVTGSATSDSDFTAPSGTVTFLAGNNTANLSVATLDDVTYDPAETVVATIDTGSYSIGGLGYATVTITDDEGTPVYWVGGYGASWSTAGNWSNNAVPDETTAVYFDSSYSDYGVAAPGSSGDLELAELHFVNGYTGTVRLESDLSVGKLELASADATLDQPSTTYGSDITGTAAMVWTDGTLNSTANLANLTITGSGTWATFAPESAGTVNIGSNITLASGANTLMRNGTINATTSNLTFDVLASCSFTANPGTGLSAVISSTFSTHFRVRSGATWTLESGTWSFSGDVRNEGTFALMGETIAVLLGNAVLDPNDPDSFYSYLQSAGATYLHGSSILLTGEGRGVKISGGILATKSAVTERSNHDSSAGISTKELLVTGGDISIGYNSHLFFGTLGVTGDVWWIGGTYHPGVRSYANGAVGDSDLWSAGGRFELGNNFTPTITPIVVDMEGAEVDRADSGIYYVLIGADTPSLPPPEGAPAYDADLWDLITILAPNDNTKVVRYHLMSK